MKDENLQELEDAIKPLLKLFEKDFNDAKAVRPSIGATESPAHFLLAALMEQIVLGNLHPALEHFFEHAAPTQELLKYQTSLDATLKNFRKDIMLPFRQYDKRNHTYIRTLTEDICAARMNDAQHFYLLISQYRALECCLVSLTSLRRWVANEDRFRPVGATRANLERVFQDCASFFLKMFEVQHVRKINFVHFDVRID